MPSMPSTRRRKTILAAAGATLLAAAIVAAGTGVASANEVGASITCDGATVHTTANYSGTNHDTITLDGTIVQDQDFGHSFTWSTTFDGVSDHAVRYVVTGSNGQKSYDETISTNGRCTPTSSTPPPPDTSGPPSSPPLTSSPPATSSPPVSSSPPASTPAHSSPAPSTSHAIAPPTSTHRTVAPVRHTQPLAQPLAQTGNQTAWELGTSAVVLLAGCALLWLTRRKGNRS